MAHSTESTSSGTSGSEIPAILSLGPDVSLQLKDNGLVIVEKVESDGLQLPCCPLFQRGEQRVDFAPISYYDVLWADYSIADAANPTVSISYLLRTSKNPHGDAKVITRILPSPKLEPTETAPFIRTLLTKAYGESKQRKHIKVLINPFGGRGQAQSIFTSAIEPVFRAAQCEIDVVTTERQGHAEDIAKELDIDAWDVVACCSGDGVPHEVFNGLARQAKPEKALAKVAVAQLPCGSGNGMSWNLYGTDGPAQAAVAVVKGIRTPMDLVSITQLDDSGNMTRKLSFLSQAVGIIAECDLATEHLRWLGDTRFSVGYVARLMRQTIWPVDLAVGIAIRDKADIKASYHKYRESDKPLPLGNVDSEESTLPELRFGTISDPLPEEWKLTPYDNLGNFYAGNMAIMTEDSNVFSTALPADGFMDLLMVDGDIPRMRAMQMAEMVTKGELIDADDAQYYKVVGYRIIPRQKEGYLSIDGERFPFRGFQAEVHNGLGCVLSKSGRMYEAKGPNPDK